MRWIVILFIGALVLVQANCAISEVRYTVVNIRGLSSGGVTAYDINDFGQIVGWSGINTGYLHAFLWQNGLIRDLGTLGGQSESQAYAISNSGQVVGESFTPPIFIYAYRHAFLWQNNTMTDLGTLGGNASEAWGINDRGQVVGRTQTEVGWRAFLWQNNVMIELDLHASEAYDINNSSQIVGYNENWLHAFLWQNGQMQNLGTLGGMYSHALAINDLGQVVGRSSIWPGYGDQHAFFWDATQGMQDIGTLVGTYRYIESQANDINESGQIVGWSHDSFGQQRATLWQPDGSIIDLNNLINPNSGWILQEAQAINNSGQIVGSGTFGGYSSRAFLLTPIPEPSSLLALVTGCVLLGGATGLRKRSS